MSAFPVVPFAVVAPSLPDPMDRRREELCLQLAENLHDQEVVDFTREMQVAGQRYVIRVTRA